ncbi:MAG TPA: hypothetical protein VIF10_01240 [Methylobacter sp.]|jgi:hypothetical protein
MEKQDFRRFAEKWADVHEAMAGGKTLSQRAMTVVFDALEEYPLDMVFQAIKLHSKKSKFAPTPNDIIEIISGCTGQKHIGADEAWGLVLDSFDENSTIVVTQEILEARGLVMDIYQTGDITGTRMAFRDTYNRIIAATSDKPVWRISLGPGAERLAGNTQQFAAVQKAIGLGRLPAGAADKYYIQAPATTVAGLIESATEKASKSSDQDFKQKAKKGFQGIKAILSIPDDDGIARRGKERLEFEAHRQEMLDRVAQKLQEKGQGNINNN